MLTETYCPHQYLSTKPICHAHFNAYKPPQSSKNRTYERGYLGNYQKWRNGISDLDSVALYAAQVCYANIPRPL